MTVRLARVNSNLINATLYFIGVGEEVVVVQIAKRDLQVGVPAFILDEIEGRESSTVTSSPPDSVHPNEAFDTTAAALDVGGECSHYSLH